MASSTTSKPALLSPRKRVVATVRQWVAEGRLARGDLLPTEQELCFQLGVSRGTVRAALQQLEDEGLLEGRSGNGRVRARTIRAAGMGATGLMANTIVLVTHLPDVDRPEADESTLGAIDTAIAAAARAAGKHVLALHGEALNDRDIGLLLDDPPMGVVVGGAVADYAPRRDALLKLVGRVPLVVNSGDALWEGCDRVISDHAAGAYELTRWALAQKRRRLVCLWPKPPLHYWVRERLEGYRRAMTEAGAEVLAPLHLQHEWDPNDHSAEAFDVRVREVAGLLVDQLIPQPRIDGILAASDHVAYVVAAACRLCNVKVHEQVLVMGYDNASACPERAFESTGPVATVDKANAAVGRRMIELLLERIAGNLPAEYQLIRSAPALVVPPVR